MKLYGKREYKGEYYTIGTLWVDGEKLCNTLEPPDRGLVNHAVPKDGHNDAWIRCKQHVVMAKRMYHPGEVAIPTGQYVVTLKKSPKFLKTDLKRGIAVSEAGLRPYVHDVPGFEGILIHEGNKPKDTLGCLLVGVNTKKGHVVESRKWLAILIDKIKAAQQRGDMVMLQIA